ncbi:hypothetical protein GOODEAATRI_000145 [Goodea atripinnis]|uniref:Uncharacterized protein n=1 Tax=Goodea atripinnis TaxID=208336 RepID=A0ABV0NRR4_9TELE
MPHLHRCHYVVLIAIIYQRDKCKTTAFSWLLASVVGGVASAWKELPTSEQLHSATLLLDTVETGAFMLADNLLKTDTVQETTDYIRKYILRFLSNKPFTVGHTVVK